MKRPTLGFLPSLLTSLAGATRAEVERDMKEAIEFHIEGMRAAGYEIPVAKAHAAYCDIPL